MVNKVTLIGNLGHNPEVHIFESGKKKVSFSVATTRRFKNKETGEQETDSTWHRCEVWGKLADIAEKFLVKGSLVHIDGSIQNSSYEKEGVTIYTSTIQVREFTMLGKKPEAQTPANTAHQPGEPGNPGEDAPF